MGTKSLLHTRLHWNVCARCVYAYARVRERYSKNVHNFVHSSGKPCSRQLEPYNFLLKANRCSADWVSLATKHK